MFPVFFPALMTEQAANYAKMWTLATEVIARRSMHVMDGSLKGDHSLDEFNRMWTEKMAVIPETGIAMWEAYMKGLTAGRSPEHLTRDLDRAFWKPATSRMRANSVRLKRR